MKNKVCIQGAGYVGAAMAVAVTSKMKQMIVLCIMFDASIYLHLVGKEELTY